ncbi:MAG: hypothetical protein ACTSP1_13145 [Candidatus Freyarchaeota archaeon]
MDKFPFLEGKVVVGRFVSIYMDGRTKRINEEIRFKLDMSGYTLVGEILDPNPLKATGLPLPSDILIVAYRWYEGENEQEKVERPIAEDILLKGDTYACFEDEVKKLLKEEEAGLILEGTVFHPQLANQSQTLKKALLSFEQENFAFTKTSCRRVLEKIKRIVGGWRTVDGSGSLCDKLKSVVGSLYSFASIGGPHEGVTTREETELILKNTTSLLFYINSLLKNERITKTAEK